MYLDIGAIISQIRSAKEFSHLRRICERQNFSARNAPDAYASEIIISHDLYCLFTICAILGIGAAGDKKVMKRSCGRMKNGGATEYVSDSYI